MCHRYLDPLENSSEHPAKADQEIGLDITDRVDERCSGHDFFQRTQRASKDFRSLYLPGTYLAQVLLVLTH